MRQQGVRWPLIRSPCELITSQQPLKGTLVDGVRDPQLPATAHMRLFRWHKDQRSGSHCLIVLLQIAKT